MAYQTINGAAIRLYINGVLYPPVKAVSLNIDYGEDAIYGIDSALPQEIRQTRISVQGQVSGLRIRTNSGLQGVGAIQLLKNTLQAPYISIEIRDRKFGDVLYFVQQAKLVSESFSTQTKGIAELTFGFKGIMILQPNDLA